MTTTRRELGPAAVVGALLLTGGNGLVSLAERHVPAGLAALLFASAPLWRLALRACAGDRPGGTTLASLLFGFAGVALLLVRGGGTHEVSGPRLLIVLGARE